MTPDSPQSYYRSRLEQTGLLLKKQTNKIRFISILRLFTIVAGVYFLISGIRTSHPLFYLAAALLLILFFALVVYHKNQSEQHDLLTELRKLNEEELQALDHAYSDKADGSEFIDPHHAWSHDLDLFGPGSLYQYMNRTATLTGKVQLSRLLTSVADSRQTITERQARVKSLCKLSDFRQLYIAHARLLEEKDDDLPSLDRWGKSVMYTSRNRWLFPVALIISGVSLTLIIAGIFNPGFFSYLLPVIFVNWGLLSPFLVKNNRYHDMVSRKAELMDQYARLLKLLAEEDPEPAVWGNMREKALQGAAGIKRLSSILGLFDQRLNMFMGAVLNSLFLFDFHVVFLLERWKKKHSGDMMEWIELTGEAEAYITMGGFAFNHPDYVYPELEEGRRYLRAKDLGHPLIPGAKRVRNDLVIEKEKVVVITGANMAGKSTFLRAIGVNTVLSYAGCPVCATEFSTGLLSLFSSMRTSDSLKDEESYFLAEIRRLRQAVELMEQGTPMLILLDEVLKGTNTTDKQLGAIGLIRKSLRHNVLEFIATHDLVLGNLEQEYPDEVINYSFESYIEELELVFDYRIRRGIAQNMNASFLMKKMGLMD